MIEKSLIFGSMLAVVKKIDTSYEHSILKKVLDFIYGFFAMLNTAYQNSFFSRMADFAVNLLRESSLIGFMIGRGRLSRWWEESFLCRFMTLCIETLTKPLRSFYQKFESVFLSSKAIGLVKILFSRLEFIAGMLLIIILIVPHGRWNNVYNIFIALLLCSAIFINSVIQRHWVFNFKALDFTLILFLVAMTMSCVTSLNRTSGIKYLMFYIAGFLMVLGIVSTVKNEKSLQTIIKMLLWGGTIIGMYGIWQALSGTVGFDPSLTDPELNFGMPGRVYATMANPNNYGEVLIMLLPFYVGTILNSKTFAQKTLYIIMSLPPLLALFNTGSRSSWIGFAVSVLVLTFLLNKRLLPFILVGAVMIIPFLPQHVYNRLVTILEPGRDSSAQTRVNILKTVWPMFKTYMFHGVGLGTDVFRQTVQNYHQYTKATPPHTHVLYLQIWIETGVAGVLTFIWYIYRTFRDSIVSIYNSSHTLKNILAAGVASLAGILTTSVAEYTWYYPRVMFIFWVVLGIITAAIALTDAKNRKLSEIR